MAQRATLGIFGRDYPMGHSTGVRSIVQRHRPRLGESSSEQDPIPGVSISEKRGGGFSARLQSEQWRDAPGTIQRLEPTLGRIPAIGQPIPNTPSHLRLVDDRTDEELLAMHRIGDPQAFRVLMGRYRTDLMRFLLRFMGDRQAAEDVFQETFFQVHLSADTFDTTRRFKPWLFTIAANKGRDLHRKNSRRSTLGFSAPIDSSTGGRTFVDLMEMDVPAPSDSMLADERDRLVQQVVDALPEHHREILLLGYFQRLTYVQMADSLQIPIGTVKSRLHAAVALFAKHWKAAAEAAEKREQAEQP